MFTYTQNLIYLTNYIPVILSLYPWDENLIPQSMSLICKKMYIMFRINSERCLNYRPHLPRVPTQKHFKKMYTCKKI